MLISTWKAARQRHSRPYTYPTPPPCSPALLSRRHPLRTLAHDQSTIGGCGRRGVGSERTRCTRRHASQSCGEGGRNWKSARRSSHARRPKRTRWTRSCRGTANGHARLCGPGDARQAECARERCSGGCDVAAATSLVLAPRTRPLALTNVSDARHARTHAHTQVGAAAHRPPRAEHVGQRKA